MNGTVKYEAAFAILCIICVTVFFVSAAVTAEMGGQTAAEDPTAHTELSEEDEQEGAYVLKEQEGRVYVYTAGAPFMLTDIDPSGLPAVDRDKLRKGISAGGRDELLALIEDFGS